MSIKNDILRLVQKRESEIPTLPVVVDRIIAAAANDKTTTDGLAHIIAYDQAMTNKLLQLANSMYYAQRNKVETIKRAISVIGFDEIIGIAMGMTILKELTDKEGLPLDMKALWIHGIGVATISKSLAQRVNPAIASKIFIPALLHDLGKLIFSQYFKEEYNKARGLAMDKKIPLYKAEKAALQIDHAALTGLLMKRWDFPPTIFFPCRFHHNPEAAPVQYRYQSLIINLADYLTQKAGIGHSGNPKAVAIKNITKKIGINESVLRLSMDQLRRREDEIKEFFRITTE
ncbi:MAG: HDOD domain-containing protein [Desulfobacterales bacterium]|nr:HDOD domain-containing protein [Desulfobacterales bacterium]